MKRPLTYFMVAFIVVLFLLQILNKSLFIQSPVNTNMDGKDCLYGYLQDDRITVYGTVSDYSMYNKYEQTTTELVLKEVFLILTNDNNSQTNPKKQNIISINENIFHTQINMEPLPSKNGNNLKNTVPVTKKGQRILVYLNESANIAIGSRIILSGKLSFFQQATNPGEFDALKYYQNRDILFAVKKASLQKISLQKSQILQNLKDFRLCQEKFLDEFLPINNASIMKAMLFGNKKDLEEEIKILYQNNGIAHILAISGLHISLIGMSIYRLFRNLPIPRFFILCGSEIFLLLYGCMVGFSASTFRAIFMFTFFLISKVVKRSYDMITAAMLSAGIQLVMHPGYLFDCGFQLSYAAVLGIAVLLPVLQNINQLVKPFYLQKVIGLFLPSLSVTLMTAPILIYHYYELSFFSIVLNFIVLPLMAPLLLIGILLLVAANLFSQMTWIPMQILGAGVNSILFLFEMGCHALECLPIGRMNIAPLSNIAILIYYGMFLILTAWVKEKRHLYQFVFPLLGILFIIFPKKPKFSAWMLDVGQGDSNVIFTEEGKVFIIDCGSTSKHNVGEKILIPFLKYHGVQRVDGVIITHPDKDHMNGILELLKLGEEENISVSQVYVYEKALVKETEKWQELMALTKQKEISLIGIGEGDSIKTKTMELKCLYPLAYQEKLIGNGASLVMQLTVEYEEKYVDLIVESAWKSNGEELAIANLENTKLTMLFTGDLEQEGERLLWKANRTKQDGENLYCDVLKVGHHGSSGSSSSDFLRWLTPDYAVISCAEKNAYGHPHEETLQRLQAEDISYFITYEEGAICVRYSVR